MSVRKPRSLARLGWPGALLISLCACGGDKEPVGPKHILLVSLDTLRADHLGAYGDVRNLTPTMDSLAQQGLTFERATAPAPTTLSSHTSMLTGTYPQTHGVVRNGFPVNPDNETLAEILSQEGFHTAAFLGSFAMDSRFGLDQGFQKYDQEFDTLLNTQRDQNQRNAQGVTSAVLRHFDALAADGNGNLPERNFLFVHYFDAHLPYEPPAKWAQRFVGAGEQQAVGTDEIEAIVQAKQREWHGVDPEQPGFGLSGSIVNGLSARQIYGARNLAIPEERIPARLYAAEIAAVDEAFAALLAGLEERGILKDTLIIISGDHGETFWEHGDLWNHGLWTYQTTLHVPWIMHMDGGPWQPGTRVSGPASTVDIVPTVLELCGIEVGPRVEGVSWLEKLADPSFDRGPIFAVAAQPYHPDVERKGLKWRNARKPHAVLWGPWKYISSEYNQVEELYHLDSDPMEQHNWLGKEEQGEEGEKDHSNPDAPSQAEVEAAHTRLRDRLEVYRKSADPLPSLYDPSQAIETARRLQAIGYGEGND